MNKCYKAENVKKDIKPAIYRKKTQGKMMEIQYLDKEYKGEIPKDLLVSKKTYTDLLVRFKRGYSNAFRDLKNVFFIFFVSYEMHKLTCDEEKKDVEVKWKTILS